MKEEKHYYKCPKCGLIIFSYIYARVMKFGNERKLVGGCMNQKCKKPVKEYIRINLKPRS